MAQLETVFVTHNFDAENDDEIPLKAGESVIVLEKDDEFRDGWWRGRNARGEIGLFPMNYTSTIAPSSLEKTIGSIEDVLSSMQLSTPTDESFGLISSDVTTSASLDKSRRSSTSGASSRSNHRSPVTKANLYRTLDASLASSSLKDTAPEDWTVDQVSLWVDMMGFKDVADTFKAQEITGDVLMELTPESLKELDIGTFGKRYKIYNAIQALRQETSVDDSSIPRRQQGFREPPAALSITGSGSPQHHAAPDQHPGGEGVAAFNRTPSVSAPIIPQRFTPPRVQSPIPLSRPDVPVQYTVKSSVGNATSIPTSLDTNDTRANDSAQGSRRTNARASFLRGSFLGSGTQKPGSIFSLVNRNSVDVRRNTISGPKGPGISDEHSKPDMEGWLHKQGDKYRTWNKRWFILQGMNLYYFKSPKDLRVKGIVNLEGYRVLGDETIHAGKYCFKLQHDRERTFYFYTDSEKAMKSWMRALMKVTISRNYNTPVLSSSTIPTVSLDAARRLKPRPPSMLMQSKDDFDYMMRHSTSDNRPFSLTSYEGSPLSHQPPLRASRSESMAPSLREQGRSTWRDQGTRQPSLSRSTSIGSSSTGRFPSQRSQPHSHTVYAVPEEDEDMIDPVYTLSRKNGAWNSESSSVFDYVRWVNQYLKRPIQHIAQLRLGEPLVELLESISGKSVRRPSPSGSASMQILDTIVAAFRFMGREGIRIDGSFTIKDVYSGNESKVRMMLDVIREWAAAEEHRITDDTATHLSY